MALLIAGWFPGEPILVLRRRADYYPDLRQILVYPGAFIVDRVQTNGAGALQDQARDGQVSLFSHYGATNPAEFFAVAAEVYFERPQRMAAEHAELYRELSRFYRVNRLSW